MAAIPSGHASAHHPFLCFFSSFPPGQSFRSSALLFFGWMRITLGKMPVWPRKRRTLPPAKRNARTHARPPPHAPSICNAMPCHAMRGQRLHNAGLLLCPRYCASSERQATPPDCSSAFWASWSFAVQCAPLAVAQLRGCYLFCFAHCFFFSFFFFVRVLFIRIPAAADSQRARSLGGHERIESACCMLHAASFFFVAQRVENGRRVDMCFSGNANPTRFLT